MTPRRVTVVAPQVRMDLGLPPECTVAELIPQLVRLAGAPPQPERGATGWVLCRMGDTPLPPGVTVSAAAVRDGEILHLRSRARIETPLLFDDVVDAIASAAQTRRGAWRPRIGRRLGLCVAAALFVGAALLVLAALSGQPQAALGCGVLAVALAFAGAALARAYGDVNAASVCAGAGTAAALLAGLVALPPHQPWPLTVESLAVAFGTAACYAAVCAVVISHRLAWFGSVAVMTAFGALITAVILLFDIPPPHAAAVTVTLVTALTAAGPMISMRLARLPLPNVPADMESFREDERPALGSEVLGVTSAAAAILTGLITALGAIAVACSAVLLWDPSPWAAILAALTGFAWLLRSRSYAGATQRVIPVAAGLAMLAGFTIHLSSTMDPDTLMTLAVFLVLAAACTLFYANRIVRNIHSPFRARWFDILEYLTLISLIPITGAVLNIYNTIRDAVS
ncbi:MAG TPA: type VII secretion integral membrane protein EccD [Actinophytocola sp.]|uniref:type VII secretion integral membrane protein EccD n=1 Tax=Actinophytocola sp. TaxID=1872138 RepID=UPI002DBA0739|nr:type VII secretion integral membrane protein EccD [Actinophytocola sp.]HEU5475318.1 type VII secretion integral membrane protein EccD [Actinophytocola sp.]